MRRIHPLFGLILCIALTLGSVASALARGQPMAVGQMEICAAGQGATVILVDAEGKPVAHVSCPDCLAGGAAALPSIPGAPAPAVRLTVLPITIPAASVVAPRNDLPAFARGPPALA